MSLQKQLLHLSIAGLFLSPLCHAQKLQTRELRITSIGHWQGNKLYLKKDTDSKTVIPISIQDMSYSHVYQINSDTIHLYQDGNSETPYLHALSASIPSNVLQPLMVLAPSPSGVHHKIFDISPKVFPYGSIRVFNGSKNSMEVALNDETVSVKPQQDITIYPTTKDKGKMWLRMKQIKSQKTIFSTMMIHRKSKRMFIFLSTPSQKKLSQAPQIFRTLVDFKQNDASTSVAHQENP